MCRILKESSSKCSLFVCCLVVRGEGDTERRGDQGSEKRREELSGIDGGGGGTLSQH